MVPPANNVIPLVPHSTPVLAPGAILFRVPSAASVTLYWPLVVDSQARAILRQAHAHPTGLADLPAGPATRPIFGAARVGRAVVTFAAFADRRRRTRRTAAPRLTLASLLPAPLRGREEGRAGGRG